MQTGFGRSDGVERRRFVMAAAGAVGAAAGAFGMSESAALAATPITTGVFHDRGGEVFNVRGYGATGDGSTDDTAAIQRAIAAAGRAGGGLVYLPQGKYLISDTLAVTNPGISLVGAGQSAATVLASSSNSANDIIRFADVTGGGVRTLRIAAQAQRTAGAAINLASAKRIVMQDIDMTGMFCGCHIGGTSGIVHIDRGYWTNFTPNSGSAIQINTNPGNAFYISNLIVDNRPAHQPLAGLLINGPHVEEVVMRSCDVLHAGTGLLINSPQMKYGFFTDCMWDSCSAYGMHVAPATGGPGVLSINLVDCWCSANAIDGCRIEGPGPVDTIQFTSHRFFASTSGNGLLALGPATNVFIDSSSAAYNGPGAGGFVFSNAISGFAVRNSRSGAHAGFGVRQSNGILVDTGCNNYVVTGNILAGNASQGFSDNGGPSKAVANNLT